jgi:hypothetical protein
MTDLAVNITNGPGAVQRDESVLRSGGQTKQYPPRPRIVTARPRPPEERRAPQPSQPPQPSSERRSGGQ